MFCAKSLSARLFPLWIAAFGLFVGGCGVLGDDSSEPASGTTSDGESSKETKAAPFGSSSEESAEGDPSIGRGEKPELPSFDTDVTPASDGTDNDPPPAATPPSTPPPPAAAQPPAAPANPGPAPAAQCSVTKDANGFFERNSGKSPYVAYVPASYSPSKPMRVIVGMHGCGDNALNFAKWGVNPWAGRASQQHIGISVGGETGNNKCWSMGNDDAKVWAAVEDLAKCFWVNQAQVVVAGFSSGGQLAYRVGMMQSSKFAGILIENSALYAAGAAVNTLLSGASRKIPIAHHAHQSDSVFPIAKVRADWSSISAMGFPLTKAESAGTHDGNSEDWMWLISQSPTWTR